MESEAAGRIIWPADDHNQDRYPELADVVDRMMQEVDPGEHHLHKLEINLLPSGEATYLLWLERDEEPVGGTFFMGDQ